MKNYDYEEGAELINTLESDDIKKFEFIAWMKINKNWKLVFAKTNLQDSDHEDFAIIINAAVIDLDLAIKPKDVLLYDTKNIAITHLRELYHTDDKEKLAKIESFDRSSNGSALPDSVIYRA